MSAHEGPRSEGYTKDGETNDVPEFLHEKGFSGIVLNAAAGHRAKVEIGLQLLGLGHWGMGQFAVLSRLYDAPMSQAEVAKLLRISPPSAMELVKRLETDGSVTRHRDPNDARRRLVTLTSVARQQIEELRRHFTASMDGTEARLWEQGFTKEDMERSKAFLRAYTELSWEETERLKRLRDSREKHGAA